MRCGENPIRVSISALTAKTVASLWSHTGRRERVAAGKEREGIKSVAAVRFLEIALDEYIKSSRYGTQSKEGPEMYSKQSPHCGNGGGGIERVSVLYMHNPLDFSN